MYICTPVRTPADSGRLPSDNKREREETIIRSPKHQLKALNSCTPNNNRKPYPQNSRQRTSKAGSKRPPPSLRLPLEVGRDKA